MPPYKIIRSKRKTIGLYIRPDSSVEVRIPLKFPNSRLPDVDKFVQSKQPWIEKHLAHMQKPIYHLTYNSPITLLGQSIPLTTIPEIPPNLPEPQLRTAIIDIYKQTAKTLIPQKVDFYAKIMRLTPTGIKITSAKTQWGSCNSQNSLNFSWRLILAPEDAINYVVVHELAHIRHKNHSPAFWTEVEKIFPNHKDLRKKLRTTREVSAHEGWL